MDRRTAVRENASKIGRKIRERRKLLGLSLADVAAEVGVSLQQVHKYETGCNALFPTKVLQFALALKIEPGELFEPSLIAMQAAPALAQPTVAESEFNHTAETIELTVAFARIRDPRRRVSLINLLEILAAD